MAKKAATFRLEESSLSWLASYAEERSRMTTGRKVAQAEVVELALASFKAECEGGVPDLPEDAKPVAVDEHVKSTSPVPSAAEWALARQRKLNEAKYR